jgi:glycosyltransferase involved in cell wall biosynthesis
VKTRLQKEFDLAGAKISVIPHGPFFYDLEASGNSNTIERFGLPKEEVIVLWQGIIFPYKGIDLLLNSWRKVEASGRKACLVVAGTGSAELLDQIEEQIRTLALQNVRLHFRFISTEELVALYRAADVVAYPYRAITTSGALATGLALGKCIVASDLPVFREMLTDGENALLVNAEDSEELSTALLRLVDSQELRRNLSLRVKEMNFGDRSWSSIAVNTKKIYLALIRTA